MVLSIIVVEMVMAGSCCDSDGSCIMCASDGCGNYGDRMVDVAVVHGGGSDAGE